MVPSQQAIWKTAASFYDILRHRAAHQPDALAYQFFRNDPSDFDTLTYSALLQRVHSLVATLGSTLQRGERVVLSMPSCGEFVATFLACQALGLISVPVPPPSRKRVDERLERILLDSGASAILTLPSLAADITLSDHSQLQGLKIIGIDDSAPAPMTFDAEKVDCRREDVTFLQYTSGSTGDPKGVEITHQNLLHNSSCIAELYALEGENHGVSWLPLFHDMGLIGGMLQPLYCGYPVTIMQPAAFLAKPVRWLQLISDLKATLSVCPNFALELCAERATEETLSTLDLSSLKVLLCGAEPIHNATLARFADVFAGAGFQRSALCPCYGLAEATLIVSGKGPGRDYATQHVNRAAFAVPGETLRAQDPATRVPVVSCGRLSQHSRIVNPDTGQVLPDWTVGEIWVSDDSVARGYWQRPTQTRETFANALAEASDERAYMRTGDLGFLADGQLYVTGRLKDLIIVRGKNVYPQDVERVASSVDDVLAVGVAAAFTATVDATEQLVVVLELSRRGLKAFADPHYATRVVGEINRAVAQECGVIPGALSFVKPMQVRRTSSGKIRRSANRQDWQAGELQSVFDWVNAGSILPDAADAPLLTSREAVEQWLIAHLAERGGMDPRDVALDQPFVTFGLDSVAALELINALQSRLPEDKQIDPTALWDFPTIGAMVAHLAGDESHAATADTAASQAQDTRLDADDEIAKLKALLS